MDGALASQPCERAWDAEGRLGGDSTSRDETKPRALEGIGYVWGQGGRGAGAGWSEGMRGVDVFMRRQSEGLRFGLAGWLWQWPGSAGEGGEGGGKG